MPENEFGVLFARGDSQSTVGYFLAAHTHKGKTRKLNQSGFTGARDSEWQWHQLGHANLNPDTTMSASHRPPLSFLQAGCPSTQPTASKH